MKEGPEKTLPQDSNLLFYKSICGFRFPKNWKRDP